MPLRTAASRVGRKLGLQSAKRVGAGRLKRWSGAGPDIGSWTPVRGALCDAVALSG